MIEILKQENFNFNANPDNKLGLFKRQGKLYQIVGYFYHWDMKELLCDTFGDLPTSDLNFTFKLFGSNFYTENYTLSPNQLNNINVTFYESINNQIKHLGFKPNECFTSFSKYNIVFLSKIYTKEVSVFDEFTSSHNQALWDFMQDKDFLPLITSISRSISLFAESSLKSNKVLNQGFKKDFVDKDIIKKCLDFSYYDKSKKIEIDNFTKKTNEQVKFVEPDIALNSDYLDVGKVLNVDLFKIQKEINQQAKAKGGFIDFNYKNKIYKIPKLPLIAWALHDCQYKTKYTIHNDTWYTISPEGIKTSDDNTFHSDWWIGAGFPIEIYKLSIHGYNYNQFNDALSDFAHSLVGKDTLEDVSILAGHSMPDFTGKVVIYPNSLTSFNEDDIIILPRASVDFEQYLLKACKNGKGAVIVENGNIAAHLAIVSNEFNKKEQKFRLILLPNANKLINDYSNITVSMKNHKIIPN